MIEPTFLGMLLGVVTRLAPEVVRGVARWGERSHELKLLELEFTQESNRWKWQAETEKFRAGAEYSVTGLEALQEGIRQQGQAKSSHPWVASFNATVRPIITYVFLLAYVGVKLAAWSVMSGEGMGGSEIALALWNSEDQLIFAGIINFFFLNRVIEKGFKIL